MSRYREPYTLIKRGKYYYYRTYTPDGLRTTAKSTGCTTKTDARRYCEDLYLHGNLLQYNVKFKTYAHNFFAEDGVYFGDRIKKLSPGTMKNYEIMLRRYVIPFFGDFSLSDINYLDLKKFRMTLIDKGLSSSYIVNTMMCLKLVLDVAFREGKISFQPFSRLEYISVEKKDRDAFTLQEVQILYQRFEDREKKAVLFLALTGLRISEAKGVTLDDIKKHPSGFDYIDLKRQWYNNEYRPLKTGDSRQVPIIPELKEMLFTDDQRCEKYRQSFYRTFKKETSDFEEKNVRGLTPHSLRHFFITKTKSDGVKDTKVETIAGHSLKGIVEVYTNYKVEDLTDILEWQQKTLEEIKKAPLIDNQRC